MDIVKFRTGNAKEAAEMGDNRERVSLTMNDEAKKRLERLLQDLQEIEEAAAGSKQSSVITCDVILSTLESPLRDPYAWKWIAFLLQEIRSQDNPEVGRTVVDNHFEVEPFINKNGCFRWSGNPVVWEKIKEWIIRLSGFFGSYPEVVPNSVPVYGLEGGLQALCDIATTVPELSPYIKRRCILDLAVQPKPDVLPTKTRPGYVEKREMPKLFEMIHPKPSFRSLEIEGSVARFAKMVLNHLLGKPLREPPVVVDLENSEVVIHGKIYAVDASVAHIIDQLLKGNGNPISRSTMQKNSNILKVENRIDRIIKDMREQQLLPIDIKTDESRRGYYLSEEWLA